MEISKRLRQPENWQDFETLCKMLWGEIWQCAEIKKNGRSGQKQNGVDICGTPFFDRGKYYGIQCKGKDGEYKHQQFTENEIAFEIEKAKGFVPPLAKLYFATSAQKDVQIEEFVRKKNIEQIQAASFEVHLFSWEDIVDLIDENPRTRDKYLQLQNYNLNQDISFMFEGDTDELQGNVLFSQLKVNYEAPRSARPIEDIERLTLSSQIRPALSLQPIFFSPKINRSYFNVPFVLKNIGSISIENYKVNLKFSGDFADIRNKPMYVGSPLCIVNDKTCYFQPKKDTLVLNDRLIFDSLQVKPNHYLSTVIIDWEFTSKSFTKAGQLKLIIQPEIRYRNERIIGRNRPVKATEEPIEDFMEDNKE